VERFQWRAGGLLARSVSAHGGAQSREVRGFLGSGRQPLEIGHRQHGIEQHQTFNGQAWRHSTAVATRDVADDVVQRLVLEVIQPCAVVHAADIVRVSESDEPIKKRVASPRTVRDATEARVLPRDAHAGVSHHEHEEARLALGEAEIDNRLDAVLVRHRHNSSANPPLRPPLRPPPLRPLTLRLTPR
jgi:hypothetical protein